VMQEYRIAVVPGDGIGTEVSIEAERVLAAAARRFGFGAKPSGSTGAATGT